MTISHRPIPLTNPTHYQPGYVYLIRAVGFGACKIGCSTEPERRMKTLQSKKTYTLELVAVIFSECYEQTEWHIKQRFQHCHLSGEWFAMTDEDIETFKSLGIAK